jgi:hypothetical protein
MNHPTTIIPGQVIGNWEVLNVAPNGRRACCLCVCGNVRIVAVDALITGTVADSCGCQNVSNDFAFLRARYDAGQRRREMQQRWRPKS